MRRNIWSETKEESLALLDTNPRYCGCYEFFISNSTWRSNLSRTDSHNRRAPTINWLWLALLNNELWNYSFIRIIGISFFTFLPYTCCKHSKFEIMKGDEILNALQENFFPTYWIKVNMFWLIERKCTTVSQKSQISYWTNKKFSIIFAAIIDK